MKLDCCQYNKKFLSKNKNCSNICSKNPRGVFHRFIHRVYDVIKITPEISLKTCLRVAIVGRI